jgi:hypothetical protein
VNDYLAQRDGLMASGDALGMTTGIAEQSSFMMVLLQMNQVWMNV